MATFQELLRKLKEQNPDLREHLTSIKKTDGSPLVTNKSLNAIRDRMKKIYEERQAQSAEQQKAEIQSQEW